MIENSSDDSEDADHFSNSLIKRDLIEVHKQSNFYTEAWPNTLPSENGSSTGNLPQPCVENILKMIRNSTRANNTQNGFKENVSADDIAKICSTVDKRELENIIGSVQRPKIQPHVPPPPPMQQSQPVSPMPQHLPIQPSNITVSTV